MKKLLRAVMLTAAMMMLSSCVAIRDAFIEAVEAKYPEWATNSTPVVVTNTPPAPVPAPEPPPPVVEQPTQPSHPFAGKRVTYKRIAKDILEWRETATITKAYVKGGSLYTEGTFPQWRPCTGGEKPLQGNFGLAVEQPDGSIVMGTWDWDRCTHQKKKDFGHNLSPTGEHEFFNLRPGARIWWFVTGLSRDNQRNVKERSNFYADTWK